MADPVNVTAPVISGRAETGQTLSCTAGTWDQPVTTTYQWQRDVAGNNVFSGIGGATSSQFGLTSADLTCHVRCAVTASSVPVNPPPGGTVIDVFPGEWTAKYAAANAGDTLYLRGGIHNKITLDRSFAANNRVTVICESGSLVKGCDLVGSAGGYIFGAAGGAYQFYTRIQASEVSNLDDISIRAFNINGPVHDVRLINTHIEGSNIAFSPYSGGSACTNIELYDSLIEKAWGDLSHPNNCNGLIIDHNIFRNPQHLTAEHHDCFQPQSTSNFEFTRNICYWTVGAGAFSGYTGSYLGQCIMLSGNAGANSTGLIANNLFHHYNGRAINMNNSSTIRIVNNTMNLCGDGISVTMGTGMSGVEVWDNIIECAYLEGPSPAYFDYNQLTGGSGGYLGNIQGTNFWTDNPQFIDTTNYELALSSPCRGRGINRPNTPTVDLDGNLRGSLVLGCRI
jgi:hypothetical protein